MHGREGLDFSNIVMFIHGTPAATDDISGALFGSYQHYFPVPVAGNTPHVIFSIKHSVQWQIQSEERFRIRSQDLYAKKTILGHSSDYLAVKTTANANVYLIHVSDFPTAPQAETPAAASTTQPTAPQVETPAAAPTTQPTAPQADAPATASTTQPTAPQAEASAAAATTQPTAPQQAAAPW